MTCDCGRPRDCLCGSCEVCCSCDARHEPEVVDPMGTTAPSDQENHVPMPKDDVKAWARLVLGNGKLSGVLGLTRSVACGIRST